MTLQDTTTSQPDALVRAASNAFATFGASSATTRATLLRGLADALESGREALVALD